MAIQNVNEVSTPFSLDPNVSLQFMYAQLQLIQSETMKKQAMGIMKQIEDTQKEQKEVAEMISRARELQDKAKNGTGDCSGDSHACYMPEDMAKWMNARGIPIESTGKDNRHNKDEWEFNIKSLTNYQDQLGTDTQTKMVYLQDYISQYNSYLQGASTQISNSADTQKTILRNS